ncbi:hypothetical protein BASA60_008155 [Batrachochytrium salamandrivorans]|nr:hypothetical protein BASA60_008155 [Batrachochytrium salamandrivorans]
MDYQRQLLAELMNPLIPSAKKDYRDADVCKHFLVAFCPNEMFLNTKVDLGKCGLLHDERLQKEYQDSPDRGRHNYEQRFYDYLTKLVSDIERTIRKGHLRLENKSGERIDAHVTGKQHTGFVKIRDTVEEHRKNGGTVRNYTNGSSISNRDYRDRDRDRDRDYNSRDRDRDRGGRRDSDRDRGGRRDSASDRRGSGSGTGRDRGQQLLQRWQALLINKYEYLVSICYAMYRLWSSRLGKASFWREC